MDLELLTKNGRQLFNPLYMVEQFEFTTKSLDGLFLVPGNPLHQGTSMPKICYDTYKLSLFSLKTIDLSYYPFIVLK